MAASVSTTSGTSSCSTATATGCSTARTCVPIRPRLAITIYEYQNWFISDTKVILNKSLNHWAKSTLKASSVVIGPTGSGFAATHFESATTGATVWTTEFVFSTLAEEKVNKMYAAEGYRPYYLEQLEQTTESGIIIYLEN